MKYIMNDIFSYKYKKKLSDNITNWCYDKLKNIPYISYIVIFIHSLFIVLLSFAIVFCEKRLLWEFRLFLCK